MKEVEIENLDAMKAYAESIAKSIGGRLLLLLDGPMGAGKTQFTTFFVQALGGKETSSPSFAIHNSYETSSISVEHFDLFRLESEDDLESTGFWDFFRTKSGVVIIEWAEKLNDFDLFDQLPRTWPRRRIQIEPHSGERRKILES